MAGGGALQIPRMRTVLLFLYLGGEARIMVPIARLSLLALRLRFFLLETGHTVEQHQSTFVSADPQEYVRRFGRSNRALPQRNETAISSLEEIHIR